MASNTAALGQDLLQLHSRFPVDLADIALRVEAPRPNLLQLELFETQMNESAYGGDPNPRSRLISLEAKVELCHTI